MGRLVTNALTACGEVLVPIAEREGVALVVLPHIGNEPAVAEVVAGRVQQLLAASGRVAGPPARSLLASRPRGDVRRDP